MKIEDFIKKTVYFFLDNAENTEVEKRLLIEYCRDTENSVLAQLVNSNMATPRISALLGAFSEIKNYKCPNCGSENWNVDCPMVVCKDCHYEIYIDNPISHNYCKTCVGYTIGDCKAKQYIDKDLQ